jgi:hypothetical protein
VKYTVNKVKEGRTVASKPHRDYSQCTVCNLRQRETMERNRKKKKRQQTIKLVNSEKLNSTKKNIIKY